MNNNKRNVTIGITGSIAAYKIIDLIRLLVKSNYNVKTVMTNAAKQFISELTVSVLSKNTVYSNYFETNQWHNHSKMAKETDILVIAPATANTITKLAIGLNDNLINTLYLSTQCPVLIAPAMDAGMWNHKSIQKNINELKSRGNIILEPLYGDLASGFVDIGRMQEPNKIFESIESILSKKNIFKNLKVLITAGPTIEKIDPVRYISNYSSGKMGYEIAQSFAENGADVFLISGKTSIEIKKELATKIELHKVESAEEMYKKVIEKYKNAKIIISTAAVSDYKITKYSSEKIKKSQENIEIKLTKNIDILKELGKLKTSEQILIGFALETNNNINNALEKIKNKNLDFIIFNSLANGSCFGSDDNQISIINKNAQILNYERKSKAIISKDIIQYIITNFKPLLEKNLNI